MQHSRRHWIGQGAALGGAAALATGVSNDTPKWAEIVRTARIQPD